MFSKLLGIFSTSNLSYNRTSTKGQQTHMESTKVQSEVNHPYYLTHADLQQVQEVMRERLRKLEVLHGSFTVAAKGYKLDGHKDVSEIYYDDANKIKKRIKALAAIQAKLKHSLLTIG